MVLRDGFRSETFIFFFWGGVEIWGHNILLKNKDGLYHKIERITNDAVMVK